MMLVQRALLLLLLGLLVACSKQEPTPIMQEPPRGGLTQQPIPRDEDLVTRNVTYAGLLEEGGVTIYQQGTHRLMLSDGKLVLLQSAEGAYIPLDLYVGKLVRVKGDVTPTVEAGGTIMEVREIGWVREERGEDGESFEMVRVLCGGGTGVSCPEGSVCKLEGTYGVCVEELKDAEAQGMSSSVSSVPDTVGTSASSASSLGGEMKEGESAVQSASYQDAFTLMVEEDYDALRWTQQYCSMHVGFCVPVHRNWYFTSFGATTTLLWHVEMSAAAVTDVGDGPLVVDLKTGDLSSLGVSDGDVKEIGSRVIGYRAWSDHRHFEVSAETPLREVVEYVTRGLVELKEEE